MPSIDLIVRKVYVAGTDADARWPIRPVVSGLSHIPIRQLVAMIRCAPHPGAFQIIIDTGASISLFPFDLWSRRWNWQPGRDFVELTVPGLGSRASGRVAGVAYTARLVRTRVQVELSGVGVGPRLPLHPLVVQLADPTGSTFDPLLGLWGNALDGRSLLVSRTPADDLAARLAF